MSVSHRIVGAKTAHRLLHQKGFWLSSSKVTIRKSFSQGRLATISSDVLNKSVIFNIFAALRADCSPILLEEKDFLM